MDARMKIASALYSVAMLWMLSGCAANVVPEDDAAGDEVAASEQELRLRFCRDDADCTAPAGPCTECSDGSLACPEAQCVRRRCEFSAPECPAPYDACEGKACGDLCTICDPKDPDCVETAVPKFCQPGAGCGTAIPVCKLQPNPCTVTLCPTGTKCVAVGDPPEAQCIPDLRVTCGGFLGTPCPGAGTCIDDPGDDCDPQNGGADCGGICVCGALGVCPFPGHFDSSPAVCDCVSGGGFCGGATCGPKEFCCNASCGICAPLGGACTQQVCDPLPAQ